MAELKIKPRQKVRFAFWGAEESGLLGSEHYVDTLSDAELGEDLRQPELRHARLAELRPLRVRRRRLGHAGPAGPPGSAEIEQMFNDYFACQGLATDPTAFDGRSDYGPFIAVGIPAGGLFSGAEGIKTAEQAAVYGGTAGEPYDACYHQACDTINNVNTDGPGRDGRRGRTRRADPGTYQDRVLPGRQPPAAAGRPIGAGRRLQGSQRHSLTPLPQRASNGPVASRDGAVSSTRRRRT